MYSMQMTGYMFRSAEYRRSLMESLGAAGESSGLLPPEAGEDETREEESEPPAQLPQAWPRLVRVRVRVRVTNPNRNRNSNPSPSPSPSPNPNPKPARTAARCAAGRHSLSVAARVPAGHAPG